jgi:tetratricopeptide (TPR) repeat protein
MDILNSKYTVVTLYLLEDGYEIDNINKDLIDYIYAILINGVTFSDNILVNNVELYYYYGIYYTLNSDIDKAIKNYYMYISYILLLSDPDDIKINKTLTYVYCNYADLLVLKNDIDEATRYYMKAINNNYVVAIHNYAYILNCLHGCKCSEKEKYYLKAIEYNCVSSMFNYAVYLYKNGNASKAKKYYLMALQNASLDPYVCIPSPHLAKLCNQVDKYTELIKMRDTLIEENRITRSNLIDKIRETECDELYNGNYTICI